MKEIKKVDILSCAKVTGTMFGGIYLVAGLFINLVVLFFSVPALKNFDILGFGSGVLATFLVALLVGSISFILGALLGWLYNLAASLVGGIIWLEIESAKSMFKKTNGQINDESKNPQAEVDNLLIKEEPKTDTFSSNDPNFLNS